MMKTIEEIKSDIKILDSDRFFVKYFVNDDYWYFENILNYSNSELQTKISEFKNIISNGFKTPISQVFLVGSAKLGFSLSPPKNKISPKLFQSFRLDGEKPSDLDIAIISEKLFNMFWDTYRNAKYHSRYEVVLRHIYQETYRGFINSQNLCEIDEGRKLWNSFIKNLIKEIANKFYIKNEISFRIYRNLNDFRQYHIQGIESIKRSI